jgi:hypothetical protein
MEPCLSRRPVSGAQRRWLRGDHSLRRMELVHNVASPRSYDDPRRRCSAASRRNSRPFIYSPSASEQNMFDDWFDLIPGVSILAGLPFHIENR